MTDPTFNPYAPPQYVGEDGTGGGRLDARIESGHLAFNIDGHIPDVCLKCGTRAGIVRRKHTFMYTPPWVILLVLLCTLGGVVAMLLTRKTAKLNLPLCAHCNGRWRAAQIGVGIALATMFAPFLLFFVADENPNVAPIMLGGFVLGLLGLIVMLATFARRRLLQVRKIDKVRITLRGVDPGAAMFIAGAPQTAHP
jgi:hypothetical protein